MLAVLARSWALCWRSWAALGAYVGGLGLLLGPMLTVLGRFRGLSWRSWAKSGSNPSEDVIWQADQGREVAQTRAGRPFWGGDRFPFFWGPERGARHLLSIFFCRYISTKKIDRSLRAPKTMDFHPLPKTAFPLGFGPLLGPDPLARSRPRSGLSHFSPKTANLGPESGPRPST